MKREQRTVRRGSTVPRALKAVVFTALVFSALTSPYLEHEAADQGASEAVDGESSPPASTAVASATTAILSPSVEQPMPTTVTTVDPLTVDGISALLPAATTRAGRPLATAHRMRDFWRSEISPEYVTYNVGCAADTSAAGLADFFSQPLGPIEGFDGPRIYPLGDGRNLWLLQDTFIDYAGGQTSFAHMDYANSSALIQDGTCFTAMQRGTPTHAESFEQGTGTITFDRYFWPGGGMVSGDKLLIFWMEMVRDPKNSGPLDGISLHPQQTWLATYDVATMRRLDFRPAPDSGVAPVYGYHVASDAQWTYLFGNSYQQNLALEGGYGYGPHSATRMYLARVPRGELGTTPTYWNGAAFTGDPAAALPISSRNFTENSMIPEPLAGRWYSATKVDGFTGTTVTIDVADNPWGPYTTVQTLPATPRGDPTRLVSYHALVLPWLDPSGGLIVSLSQIPLELGADDAPPKYRPNFWLIPVAR